MDGIFDQHHPIHHALNTNSNDDGDSSEYARMTQYLHATKNTTKYALHIARHNNTTTQ